MKKYLILVALAALSISASADIPKLLKKYEAKTKDMAETVNNPEDFPALADSLLKINPKDPFYNYINVISNIGTEQDSAKIVAAAEFGLKNLPGKEKDLRKMLMHVKGAFLTTADSVAAFDILKQAWRAEPWSYTFTDLVSLCYKFGDAATLKYVIDTHPEDMEAGPVDAANLMLSSLENKDADIYESVIKFTDKYPGETALMVAFDVIKQAAPAQLPKLVAHLSTEYTPTQLFAKYYSNNREAVEAEFATLRKETPEKDKWNVDAARAAMHYLLGETKEAWDILVYMDENNIGDEDFRKELLIDLTRRLGYTRELIKYTDDLPLSGLPEDIAIARLMSLVETDRKEETIDLANRIMLKQPDLAYFAYFAIALAEFNDHQWQAAMDAFNTASIYNEKEGAVLLNQAYILDKLGRKQEAEDLFKSLIDWKDEDQIMLGAEEIRALAKTFIGDKEGALEYADAKTAVPDIEWYNCSIPSFIYYYCGEKEKGAAMLKRANELYPYAIDIITSSAEWDPFREDVKALQQNPELNKE